MKERATVLENRKGPGPYDYNPMKELSETAPSQWIEQTMGYEVRERV